MFVSPYDLILSTYINCVTLCSMHYAHKNVEIRERKITSIKRKETKNGRYSDLEVSYN